MFQHILVPLDGSHLAEAALQPAMEIAAKFDGRMTLLRVLQPVRLSVSSPDGSAFARLVHEMQHHAEADAKGYLKGLQGSLRQQGFVVHTHFMRGEQVANAILDAVQGLDVDAIVMSTHGRSGFSRIVYGSIADKVLRQADVPILLIRAQENQEGLIMEPESETAVTEL
jgi:nucleotide-binding universal stress UspA family protein